MTFKQVTLAIVIPNYNDVKTLSRSIYSAINQNPKPNEVIIIDDCSTDASFDIAIEFQKKYKQVRVIRNKKNLGVMEALNIGLSEVNSDYVLFLSANDYLLSGIVNIAKETLTKKQAGIWSALILKEENKKNKLYPSPIVLKKEGYISPEKCISNLHKVGSWFTGTTMFFKVEALKELEGFVGKYHGLADMHAAMILSSKYGAYFVPHPYGVVSDHEDGLLKRTLLNDGELKKIIELMAKDGSLKNPNLFTNSFKNKCKKRLQFSAEMAHIKNTKFKILIAAKLFIKLRIFELIPFIYHRFFIKKLMKINEN